MFRGIVHHLAGVRRRIGRVFNGRNLAHCVVLAAVAAAVTPGSRAAAEQTTGVILKPVRHREFQVPQGLRARVDFWKSIFAKYGQHQIIIHHRDFPQAVFGVVDLSTEAAGLGPIGLDVMKRREVDRAVDRVKGALRRLAAGGAPSTALESRIAAEMAFIPGGAYKYKRMLDDDLVRSQTGIKEKFAEAVKRSGRYLPIIEKIFVKDFNLPVEITRLPFVESSFDYQAYSSVGAAGIWQFMPKTARLYMSVNNLVDERRDPIESSTAAARYLSQAHSRIGTWPLAVTSYNHGVAGVIRKVRAAGTPDIVSLIESPGREERAFGFASSNFFPSLLAAIEVFDERRKFFPDVELEPALRIAKLRLPKPAKINLIAEQLDCGVEQMKKVNYALSAMLWQGRYNVPAGYVVKVPVDCAAKIAHINLPDVKEVSASRESSAVYGGQIYKVRKGDTLLSLAQRFGVPSDKLRELNGLPGDGLKIGQVLIIRLHEGGAAQGRKLFDRQKVAQLRRAPGAGLRLGDGESVLQSATAQTTKKSQVKKAAVQKNTYQVSPGDTLYSLARKFSVTVEQLKKENKISGSSVHVGDVLKIPRAK